LPKDESHSQRGRNAKPKVVFSRPIVIPGILSPGQSHLLRHLPPANSMVTLEPSNKTVFTTSNDTGKSTGINPFPIDLYSGSGWAGLCTLTYALVNEINSIDTQTARMKNPTRARAAADEIRRRSIAPIPIPAIEIGGLIPTASAAGEWIVNG
jgi:hypothetical protein